MVRRDGLDDAERLRVAVGDFVRRARAEDSMPAGQAAVLGHLDRTGPVSITDLAARAGVRHQSMARTVALLHAGGLVTVDSDPHDHRRVRVELTAAGRTRLDADRSRRAGWIAAAAHDHLDADERAVYRQIPAVLAKLSSAP